MVATDFASSIFASCVFSGLRSGIQDGYRMEATESRECVASILLLDLCCSVNNRCSWPLAEEQNQDQKPIHTPVLCSCGGSGFRPSVPLKAGFADVRAIYASLRPQSSSLFSCQRSPRETQVPLALGRWCIYRTCFQNYTRMRENQ